MTTFYLFGLGWFTSVILGLSLTGLITAAGHLAYEKILMRYEISQVVVIASALLLCSGAFSNWPKREARW